MHVDIVLPLACITAFSMDEALLSISLVSRGQLVKILITLESHGIFESHCAYLFILSLSNVQPRVYKTVNRLCRASFRPAEVF